MSETRPMPGSEYLIVRDGRSEDVDTLDECRSTCTFEVSSEETSAMPLLSPVAIHRFTALRILNE